MKILPEYVKNSFRASKEGKEKIWKIFWFYFIVGMIIISTIFQIVGMLFIYLNRDFASFLFPTLMIFSLVFVLGYHIFILFMLYKNRKNVSNRVYFYIAFLIVLIPALSKFVDIII
jgi:hypothetical protein